MTKHRSPFSVDYQTPVFITSNDPRNKDEATFEKYRARIGRDVEKVDVAQPLTLQEYIPIPKYWIQTTEYTSSSASRLNTANSNYIWYVENTNDSQHSSSVKITKYKQNGEIVWQKLLTDVKNLFISSIVCDIDNNLYIAGIVGYDAISLTVQYGYIAKIDTSGTILWEKIVNKAPSSSSENIMIQNINAIALDSNNNVYASLQYNRNITLIKYNTSGSVLWNIDITDSTMNIYGGYNILYCYSLAVDSSNNCYITGQWNNDHSTYLTYLLKVDPNGIIQWQKTSSNLNATIASTSIIDQNNNFLVGISKSYGYDLHPVLLKFNSSGTLLSNTSFPVGSTLYGRTISQIMINNIGNLYWINRAGDNNLASEIYKIDTNYSILWKKDYQTSLQSSRLNSISIMSQGFIISNSNSIAYLPVDGTKTGSYFVGPLPTYIYYADSAYNENGSYSIAFTDISYESISTPYFFSNSYSTTVTTPTYAASIVYI